MRRLLVAAALLWACSSGTPKVVFGMPASAVWPQQPLLPKAVGPRIAFTDNGEDTLFFADLATFTAIGKVPVGQDPLEKEGPHHLQASPDGRYLYVGIANTAPPAVNSSGPHGSHGAGSEDGYLLQVDTATGRTVAQRRVGRNPGDVRFDPTGRYIWQSHFDIQAIADALKAASGGVVDYSLMDSPVYITKVPEMQPAAMFKICAGSHGIGFAPDGKTAYIACDESDQVAIIDVADGLPANPLHPAVQRVDVGPLPGLPPTPWYQPYGLAVSPVDGRVFVSNLGAVVTAEGREVTNSADIPDHIDGGGLVVLDPATRQIVTTAAVPYNGRAAFGAFTADGSRYYVAAQGTPDTTDPAHLRTLDHMLEVDPSSSTVLRSCDLTQLGCLNAHAARLSPDESEVWVTCEGDHAKENGTFEVIDRQTFAAKAHLELGLFPDDAVVVPMPGGAK